MVASAPKVDETRRRTAVLQELYLQYSAESTDDTGMNDHRDMLPPDGWVNDRLESRHEPWRVHNVDGFRCEIFDLR